MSVRVYGGVTSPEKEYSSNMPGLGNLNLSSVTRHEIDSFFFFFCLFVFYDEGVKNNPSFYLELR